MNQGTSVGSRPIADNNKGIESRTAYFAPAIAGAALSVTPASAHESVGIANKSGDLVRVQVNFSAGINATPATATNRTFLVAPGDSYTVDFGANDGDNAAAAVLPIASLTITPVVAPSGAANASADASALVATTAAQTQGGLVICNFATS